MNIDTLLRWALPLSTLAAPFCAIGLLLYAIAWVLR